MNEEVIDGIVTISSSFKEDSSFSFPFRQETHPCSCLIFSLDGLFLGDVDAVEELTDVLVLDEDALLDLGGRLGDLLEVVALEGDLVLLAGLDALDAVEHGHAANVLLTEEVAHLHRLAFILNGNVDREMSVDALHLVTVSVGDALHHVLDVADDGSHGSDVFAAAEPFLDLNSLLAEHLDVQLGVLEGLAKESSLALNGDNAVVHRGRDAFRDLHLQARVNGLHLLGLKSPDVSD